MVTETTLNDLPEHYKLLFGRYDLTEVEVHDPGLERYMNLSPIAVPHVGGKFANKRFGKNEVNIVERFINNMMRTDSYTGKKSKAYRAVREAFAIIEERTEENPVQILIDALENSAPKEEITRLRFGGISVPKAVDSSCARRLDIALRNLSKGVIMATHKQKRSVAQCLAAELMSAAKNDPNNYAVRKKDESERVAASAR